MLEARSPHQKVDSATKDLRTRYRPTIAHIISLNSKDGHWRMRMVIPLQSVDVGRPVSSREMEQNMRLILPLFI